MKGERENVKAVAHCVFPAKALDVVGLFLWVCKDCLGLVLRLLCRG